MVYRVTCALVGVLLATLLAPWAGAESLSIEDQEQFLLKAKIIKKERLEVGVTRSARAVLSDGELTHDAHIQTVDIHLQRFTGKNYTELDHKDSYKFNIAAYRLDRLLGLGMVPATVERSVKGDRASVTWWVDDILMTGPELGETDARPTDAHGFSCQRTQGWVFQNLVYNTDPNLGNFIIDEDWHYWMIDFTRAFRRWKRLLEEGELNQVPRSFFERLQALESKAVKRELGRYLTSAEIKGLMARRDLLVEHFLQSAEEKGENAVFLEACP
jgi:hypothetical protein